MPTNRTKRTRKQAKTVLSDSWRYFLETGNYCVKKKFPDVSHYDQFHIFQLGNPSPGYREKLKAVWMQHKNDILKNWKLKEKKGLLWAAVLFDKNSELMERFEFK